MGLAALAGASGGAWAAGPSLTGPAAWAAPPPAGAATVGTPVEAHGRAAFQQPAPNLDRAAHRAFATGRARFHEPWAPATPARGGAPDLPGEAGRTASAPLPTLGVVAANPPLQGAAGTLAQAGLPRACAACHRHDGRGHPADAGTRLSGRVAPQLVGVGLLDTVDEADILANARNQAAMPGPIKGRVNRVREPFDEREAVGRFGWKAGSASLHQQVATALWHDLGLRTDRVPGDGAAPDVDQAAFVELLDYSFGLGVPAARVRDAAQWRRGQRLFAQAQCAVCHRPDYVTGKGWFPALSRQRIWPYTDFLLHDMGPALAERVRPGTARGRENGKDGTAGAREWRTPPLWGLGVIAQVNGHRRLLHDGRANGVREAIEWHGGEAAISRAVVRRMSARDVAALVAFVESL